MQSRILPPFAALLLLLTPLAHATGPECESLLVHGILKQKLIDRAETRQLHLAIDLARVNPADTLTVDITRAPQPGRFGEQYLLTRLPEQNWYSTAGGENHAPAGEPRHFLAIVGKDVGKFFGYELRVGEQMLLPTVAYLEGALATLRGRLPKEGLSLGFYEASSITPNRKLVERFVREAKLPIATDGTTLLHDHSFHVAALFIPDVVTRLAQRQIGALLDFQRYVERTAPEFAAQFEVHAFFEHLTNQLAHVIDFGTGNFSYALARYEVTNRHRTFERDFFRHGFELFASRGQSPKELISKISSGYKPGAQTYVQEIDLALPGYGSTKAKLQDLANAYIASQAHDPKFSEGLELNSREFLKMIHRRKLRIEAAIRLHFREQSPPTR